MSGSLKFAPIMLAHSSTEATRAVSLERLYRTDKGRTLDVLVVCKFEPQVTQYAPYGHEGSRLRSAG